METKTEDQNDSEGNSTVASDSEEELSPQTHKQSLEKLKKIDPDFYNFLEENDKNLLNFDVDKEDTEEADEENDEDDENVHKPGPIKGDSDESDFEDETTKPIHGKVTLKMVSEWQNQLQNKSKIKLTTLTTVIKVFNAAMLRATSEDGTSQGEYKVEGSSVFNAVIQMCVLYLPTAIKKYLGMEQSGKDPKKCKHFVRIKGPLVSYLNDLLKLMNGVTSENILTVLIKHLHQMTIFVACFSRISRLALKKVIGLWSSGEEHVRVLAFLCILRITRNQQSLLLDNVLKTMYITYVKNCKFVSPSTWPNINFMRRSLIEMYNLDLNASYKHAFLYIRQLAIHLRNAIIVQKTENRQAVCNWQFINSLHLWANLLGSKSNHSQLQQLIYPLTTVITHTIKLSPTHQYYPLRFHCIEILIDFSKQSNTFIPILPFLVEVMSYDFNKKHSKVSMKPLDFSCIIRLSKSQLMENGFKDAVIEKLYGLTLEYITNQSYNIAFPDFILLAVIQIKKFIKTCSVSNYTKKFKQLLEKIEENSKFIETEREKITFHMSEEKLITAWETTIKNNGTPLMKYFESWSKINKIQGRKKITKNDEVAMKLPKIMRLKMPEHKLELKKPETKRPLVLFPSDSEDEKIGFGSDSEEKKLKIKKFKKKKKESHKTMEIIDVVGGSPDVVDDFSLNDW